ncbi:MAG TPA: metallophosphoesterase [Acidimicrobiales bacterium]|nr:metallophosphoesterase [Acidimicrobiales bacterium]
MHPDADITTVGPDVVVVHHERRARRYDDLAPGEVHELDGLEVRTLDHPGGELLARFATVNDVHFGEVRCGVVEGHEETIGPILQAEPDEPPYPVTMNEAAVAEIQAADVDAVFVKGDLTTTGTDEEYADFLDTYQGAFGDRLTHVRGNHDAYRGQSYADWPVQRVDLPGVTVVLLDTTVPFRSSGGLTVEQLDELDEIAAEADRPVVVLGHHHVWAPSSAERPDTYFGIHPDWSERLVEVAARRPRIVGYFAGHTHRNRVRRFAATGAMPWVEVACVKDFPGAWAEYRVHEGGIVQLHHRISTPEALDWTERTRGMFLGMYGQYAFGKLEDRCFMLDR